MSRFTEEERAELKELIVAAMDERRARVLAEREAVIEEKHTGLFLISFAGNVLAAPDEKGRAVVHQSAYARITYTGKRPNSYSVEDALIVAFGDARKLKTPLPATFTSMIVSLISVPEELLRDSE